MLVTKRNGTQEEYQVSKIKRVIEWACEDLDVESVELETGLDPYLQEGVSTEFLHKQLISNAKQLISPDEPEWNMVSGKLLMQDIWKRAKRNRGYSYSLQDRLRNYNYNPAAYTYTDKEIDILNSHIDVYRDFLFDYAGAYYLSTKYLLKDELPQEMWMINAMILMSSESPDIRIKRVIELYDYLSQLKISLATPILLNLREVNGNCSSCFIISVDDNLESIYHNLTNAAQISKNAGGIGVNLSKIRGLGSYIQDIPNASGGVLPWIKLFNDTAIAVNQKGKRPGAITVALDSWHIDIESFIEVNSEVGDFRVKSPDIFPQVVVSDEYMRRVENDEDWTLIDPHEVLKVYGVDITELWGDKFTTFYNQITSENKLTLTSTIKAKDLFKEIIKSQHETGLPYIFFKDTANKYNSDRDIGYIPNANLCVAPETKILTKDGECIISEVEGQYVEVWNGEEWSEVLVRKTGENKELLRVVIAYTVYSKETNYDIDLGIPYLVTIDCTPEHDFYVEDKYSVTKVKAKDLNMKDCLEPWNLPNEDYVDDAYVMAIEHTGRISDTYCFEEFKRNRGTFNGVVTGQCVESYSNVSSKASHVCNLSSLVLANLKDDEIEPATKLCVRLLDNLIDLTEEPIQEAKNHNQKYRTIGIGAMGLADWLALKNKGYYTGIELASHLFEDIAYYAASESSEIASTKGSFGTYNQSSWSRGELFGRPLYDLLAKSYSKDRWIKLNKDIERQGMRNSKLLAIAPNCQDPNNKVQTSNGVFSIYEILISQGFDIEEIENKEPHWINLKTPVKVPTLSGEDICERVWYNGQHPTVSIEFEDGEVYTYTLNHKLLVEREYYLEWVECEKLKIGDIVTTNSELNIGIKSLTVNKPTTTYDFEVKNNHHYFMENGVVSHNTSTSLLMGCTASILPPVAKVISVKTGDGAFNIPCKYLKTHRFHYIANKDVDQKVIVDLVSKIQTWVCQGISMELMFDKNSNLYSPKYVYEVLMDAWKKECKTIYYIRWVEKKFKEACESCAG